MLMTLIIAMYVFLSVLVDASDLTLQRHSEVPEKDEDWPILSSILVFRDRVRARLLKLYGDLQSGKRTLNRHIARMLVLTHEHESWHVEVSNTAYATTFQRLMSRSDAAVYAHSKGWNRHAPSPWVYYSSLAGTCGAMERWPLPYYPNRYPWSRNGDHGT